ncbi:MAG TPA: phosphoglucosamine mutase, partial [Petrotogaceae bacterium]|nr:phosphoglucosamine mutase [Petrotogaceae bacterium]
KLYRTQVGDKYVLEKMLEISSNIGGEQSGHIIMLDRSTTGDGLITALETIDTMNFFSKPIDLLVGEIPEYPQVLKNVAVKDKKKIMTDERMTSALKKYEASKEIRLLVRPSGTEHKIRVMTEGKDEKLVNEIAQEFAELIDIIDKE